MESNRSVGITIVGLGHCGGELAAAFADLGYPAIAVDTSYGDLSALEQLPEHARVYIGLHGRDGTGKDSSLGEYSLRENAEAVRRAVEHVAAGSDAILLCGGLGGGTGGALASLVEVLAPLSLPTLAAFVMPGANEPGPVKVNAVRAADRLFASTAVGLIGLDADRLLPEADGGRLQDALTFGARGFAAKLDAFNRVGARTDLISIRSFDGEDLRRVLFAGRFVTFGEEPLAVPLDSKNIVALYQRVTSGSGALLSGHLRAAASFAALVLIVPQGYLEGTSGHVFENAIAEARRQLDGAALYVGLYVSNDATEPRLLGMASGMPIPDQLHELSARARQEGNEFCRKLKAPAPRLDVKGLEGLSLFGKSFRGNRAGQARTST